MKTKLSIALAALAVLAFLTGSADAAKAKTAAATIAASMNLSTGPDCAAPAPVPCAPVPCAPVSCAPCAPTITYVHHGRLPCGCCCTTPIQTALEVKIPCGCTCTTTLIPVCLPSCCTGTPQVTCHWGPLGRGVVRYDYCCGVSVKIIVQRCGNFVVHYIHA
jgi:hypothetical protein